jgi:protein-tyrosine phosphatase
MFEILTVCSANVCRSPLAAAALASNDLLRARPEVSVSSAGMWATDGATMCADAASHLSDQPASHRARAVDPGIIRRAGLILVAERRHRAAIVTAVPDASSKTFTLREAAALCSAVCAFESLNDLVRRMNAARGTIAYPDPLVLPRRGFRRAQVDALDIPDSHAPPFVRHGVVLAEVVTSVTAISHAMCRSFQQA